MFQINNKKNNKGFTLAELLIVMLVVVVVTAFLVITINPGGIFMKVRDARRIADLSNLKRAIGLYLISNVSPQLDGINGIKNDQCAGGVLANKKIWVSVPLDAYKIIDVTPPVGWARRVSSWVQPSNLVAARLMSGAGWLPISLSSVGGGFGGQSIFELPVDPVNRVADPGDVTNRDLIYRYACKKSPLTFEIDARMESDEYTNNKTGLQVKDGGNNSDLYEVGTDLMILPATNNEF